MSVALSSRSASCRCHRVSNAFKASPTRTVSLRVPPTPRFGSGSLAPARRGSVTCNGLFGLGLPEVAVIAGVAALIWGPSKLPEIGKGLGKTLKSFQSAAKEFEQELKTEMADNPATPEKPAADAKADAPTADKAQQK